MTGAVRKWLGSQMARLTIVSTRKMPQVDYYPDSKVQLLYPAAGTQCGIPVPVNDPEQPSQ